MRRPGEARLSLAIAVINNTETDASPLCVRMEESGMRLTAITTALALTSMFWVACEDGEPPADGGEKDGPGVSDRGPPDKFSGGDAEAGPPDSKAPDGGGATGALILFGDLHTHTFYSLRGHVLAGAAHRLALK